MAMNGYGLLITSDFYIGIGFDSRPPANSNQTEDMTGNERPRWSNEEVLRMLDMIDQGMTDRQIGEALCRTAHSVMSKRRRLGGCP